MAEHRSGPAPQTTRDLAPGPGETRSARSADDTEDEHGHPIGSDVERVEHGFAPLKDPVLDVANAPRGDRHAREAEVLEEIAARGDPSPLVEPLPSPEPTAPATTTTPADPGTEPTKPPPPKPAPKKD